MIRAYEEQCEAVEGMGGRIILMASRALAKTARSPADYERVYARVLSGVRQPVIIHWLGEMFDPALQGYWGSDDHGAAMDTALAVIRGHADKVDGIKISLLDSGKEVAMRRRLPRGVRMYTGDDFNYAECIEGCARHGIPGISPWRDVLQAMGVAQAAHPRRRAARVGPVPGRHVPRLRRGRAVRRH